MNKKILITVFFILLFSFSIFAIDIKIKDDENFKLEDNLIELKNITTINKINEFYDDKLKTKHDNLNINQLEDDLNINSDVLSCNIDGIDLYCYIEMDNAYKIYFNDYANGIVKPKKYYKENDYYLIIFDGVYSGELHIGKESDIYFLGNEPHFYYHPRNESLIVIDETPNGNNGSLENGALIITANNKNRFSFDGTDDSVNASDIDFIIGDFGINFWVRVDAHVAASALFYKGSQAARWISCQQSIGNDGICYFDDGITAYIVGDNGNNRMYDSNEKMVTLTRIGSTLYLYINGVLNDTQLVTNIDFAENTDLYFGSTNFGIRYWSGEMWNILIDGGSLNQSSITALYNLGDVNYYQTKVPPTINITNPLNQSAVTGFVNIAYLCSDVNGDGVNSSLYVDDSLLFNGSFEHTNETYNFNLVADGTHTILAGCSDINTTTTSYIEVTTGIASSSVGSDVDFSSLNTTLIILGIIFLYIGMLAIGVLKQSFAVLSGAVFVGLILGISLFSYNNILGIVLILLNMGFFLTIVVNARNG